MLENAFINRPTRPTDADLVSALGAAQPVWDELLATLAREQLTTGHEWKTHNVKWGWSLRVVKKKRTIVWLSPGHGGFNVSFILGDKAVAAARAARLRMDVRHALATAPHYPEGTGLRLVVKSARDLPALRQLAAIKAAN
jgi:hypothetical protein